KPSSEVTSTASSEASNSETVHSEVSATNTPTNNENLIISTSPDKTTLDTSQKDGDFTITVEAEGITKKTDKRESFVSDANGVTYYVDTKGQLVTGPKEINGFQYYFNNDGTMVKGQLRKVDDKLHFYDENDGKLVTDCFITFKDNHYIPEENYSKVVYFNEPAYIEPNYYVMPGLERYYFDKNGNTLKKGRQTILGDDYYIYDNGQVAVHRLMELDHKRYYFDDKGTLAKNKQFPIIEKGLWKSMPYVFYSDHDGVADYLNKKLNIVTYPFPIYYTLPSENNREYPKNQFMMDYEGRWYYFNKDGFPITGPKTIDGFELYFHESSRPEGHQAKGEFINIDNKIYYFDKDNGRKVKDTSFELNGIYYIADKEGNITIQGSNVAAGNGLTVKAKNIDIREAENRVYSDDYYSKKKSGILGGGIGVTFGSQKQTTESDQTKLYAQGSQVGSLSGNTTMIAENTYTQTASKVSAIKDGDVNILAKKVDIKAADDKYETNTKQTFEQKGLTIAITSPVISAMQAAQGVVQSTRQVGESKHGRVNAMAAANAGFDAYRAADSVMKASNSIQKAMSNSDVDSVVGGQITYGQQKSESRTHTEGKTAAKSQVNAGGKVNIVATGAGKDS
ncbi:MAG: hemagglutinin repeat-containing protein, partial [Streptococcus sp.]|nr:hemagglutinin repeat-containing protein [Streptococcus sp.]